MQKRSNYHFKVADWVVIFVKSAEFEPVKKAKENCFYELLWSVHLCPLPKKGGMLLKKRSWTRPKLTPLKANLSRRVLKKNGDFFVWGPRSLKFGFLVKVYVYINNLGSNLGSLTQKRRKSLFSFWAKWLFLSCY